MDIKIIWTIIRYALLMIGHHWDLDNILSGEKGITDSDISKLEPGDLILRAAMDKFGKLIYHAGVYSGDNKVIHFTSQIKKVKFSLSVSLEEEDKVEEISVMRFINDQTFFALRLKSGIPKNFESRVKMSLKYYTKKYNLLTNNCLHFAFSLLGVQLENNSFMDIVLKANDIYEYLLRSLTWPWTNYNSLLELIMNPVLHYWGVYNTMILCHSLNIFGFPTGCNDIITNRPGCVANIAGCVANSAGCVANSAGCALCDGIVLCT